MATGKDFSNPLIVDSLLKTIWLSMHHVFTMKHWLVQSKRLLEYKEFSNPSTSSQQDQDNQDCIVMPIWKDASYFGNAAPRTDADDGLQDENDATEKSHEDSSLKDNVNTATPEDLVGPSHASEDTQVEDQEIELGTCPLSYAVPTTPPQEFTKITQMNMFIGDVSHLFKKKNYHFLLYDIIFGSTKKELCDEFEKLMKDKFQMSSIGELTFFLGLQSNRIIKHFTGRTPLTLHSYNRSRIVTRNEKEIVVLERETRERIEREKRKDIFRYFEQLTFPSGKVSL
ncbi:hypothetical protein Tco_0316484 [Tanacetum coccineum]